MRKDGHKREEDGSCVGAVVMYTLCMILFATPWRPLACALMLLPTPHRPNPHTTYLFDDGRIFLCFSTQQVKLARGRVLADFTDTATPFEKVELPSAAAQGRQGL